MLAKFIAITALFAVSFLVGIGVLIYGWGLEPRNWWWIIGGGLCARAFVEVLAMLTKNDKTK